MSGGILIVLAADEIVMDINAVLGPIDPQLGKYPAASIMIMLQVCMFIMQGSAVLKRLI